MLCTVQCMTSFWNHSDSPRATFSIAANSKHVKWTFHKLLFCPNPIDDLLRRLVNLLLRSLESKHRSGFLFLLPLLLNQTTSYCTQYRTMWCHSCIISRSHGYCKMLRTDGCLSAFCRLYITRRQPTLLSSYLFPSRI